jgi:hypothetical protein
MIYQEELDRAEQLVAEGKNVEAAKLYEDIGTKCLREGGEEERKEAPKIFGKSIARYLISGEKTKAQDLAFQVQNMKNEDPFLSIQIETAISTKKSLIRSFFIESIPEEMTEEFQKLHTIPQNRKIMKIKNGVTIKKMWEWTVFGEMKPKFDLLEQQFESPEKMINYLMATNTGVIIVAAELENGQKILVETAVTFNEDPVEIIEPKISK